MCPYSTQTCILEARTMLTKEVFFYLIKKPFSIFRVSEMVFFCEGPTRNMLQNLGDSFFNMLEHVICTNNKFFFLKKDFHPPLLKITSFCRFSWKRDKFELQVPRNLLMIFGQNHFRYTTAYFNIDTPRVSEYTTPSYELSCPPS